MFPCWPRTNRVDALLNISSTHKFCSGRKSDITLQHYNHLDKLSSRYRLLCSNAFQPSELTLAVQGYFQTLLSCRGKEPGGVKNTGVTVRPHLPASFSRGIWRAATSRQSGNKTTRAHSHWWTQVSMPLTTSQSNPQTTKSSLHFVLLFS